MLDPFSFNDTRIFVIFYNVEVFCFLGIDESAAAAAAVLLSSRIFSGGEIFFSGGTDEFVRSGGRG